MTIEERDELIKLLSEKFEAIVVERFNQLGLKIDSVQKTADGIYGDLDADRGNLSKMAIDTATITQATREISENLNKHEKRIATMVLEKTNETIETTADKVADKVEPAMQKVVNKMRNGIPLGKKKPWWKFW
jgi:membrane-associated HD superfamily phosphohydrolase